MNNTIVSPAEYFEQVKSRKQTMTAAGLSQLYENCIALLEEYQRSGQIAAQKKLLFHIDNITREKKLLDLGIDTFVYKSDVDDFIHMVDNKVVKIVELENYQRRIPEEIIQRIERCKGIFDKMYVVFTDYTKREERRVEAIKREKDPILFGTFQDTATRTVVERFYFIGDWTDEYCDLTLDKMVAVVKEKADRDIRIMVIKPRIEGEGLENIIIAGAAPKIFEVIIFDFVVNLCTDFFCGIVFRFRNSIHKERDIAFLPFRKRVIMVAGVLKIHTERPFFAYTFRRHHNDAKQFMFFPIQKAKGKQRFEPISVGSICKHISPACFAFRISNVSGTNRWNVIQIVFNGLFDILFGHLRLRIFQCSFHSFLQAVCMREAHTKTVTHRILLFFKGQTTKEWNSLPSPVLLFAKAFRTCREPVR